MKISKKKLYQYYIIDKLSSIEIARYFDCAPCTIRRKLHKYNIKLRTNSESQKLRLKNPKNHPNWKTGKTKSKFGYNFVLIRTQRK